MCIQVSRVIWLCILVAPIALGQSPSQSSAAEQYAGYIAVLGGGPVTLDGFKKAEEFLKRDGFRQLDENRWRYSDEHGSVLLMAYPTIGTSNLVLTPKKVGSFGDAALAALIARAENIFIEPGDSVQLRFPARVRNKDGRRGQIVDTLYFTLDGASWWRSSCRIEWGE